MRTPNHRVVTGRTLKPGMPGTWQVTSLVVVQTGLFTSRAFEPKARVYLRKSTRDHVCHAAMRLGFIGNPPKVLALVLRNRGNGDLKCSAKDDLCRMLNACDATTVGNRSA